MLDDNNSSQALPHSIRHLDLPLSQCLRYLQYNSAILPSNINISQTSPQAHLLLFTLASTLLLRNGSVPIFLYIGIAFAGLIQ